MHPAHRHVLCTLDAPHPLAVLHAVTDAAGGREWLTWGPDTLRVLLESGDVRATPSAIRAARAVQTVATREDFWELHQHFHLLAQALCGLPFRTGEMDSIPLRYLYLAVDGAREVRHALGVHEPMYSDTICAYVGAQALYQNVWLLLDVLSFAQPWCTKRYYRCRTCGNERPVWTPDGYCDVCTDRFAMHNMLDPMPDYDKVRAGIGKDIVYFEKNPPGPVLDVLRHIAAHPSEDLPESQAGVCASRVLDDLEWLTTRREDAARAAILAAEPPAKVASALNSLAANAASHVHGAQKYVTEGAKGWWASEAPHLKNLVTNPVQAWRHGIEQITAPSQGMGLTSLPGVGKYISPSVDRGTEYALRGLGVAGTAYGAKVDAAAEEEGTGRRRGIAERALGTVGGLHASVGGWPLGMVAGMATGVAGSMGGAAVGRAIDRHMGWVPQQPDPPSPPAQHAPPAMPVQGAPTLPPPTYAPAPTQPAVNPNIPPRA